MDSVGRQLRQDTEEKIERDADRQLREESIESDQGIEPLMAVGRETTRRIAEITDAQGWGELDSGATIREKEESRSQDSMTERWNRMEEWILDNTRKNAAVREEMERARTSAQEERGRWEEMMREIRELKEEIVKARREAGEGTGEWKKWLARMGNENREGERTGYKNQAAIMDSLSKLFVNHNVSREDHKSIYREITMLETAMGSTVRATVSEVTEKLRWELKKIFESLAEDTPILKKEPKSLVPDSDTDTDTDTEKKEESRSIRKGYRGTIGGRRGGAGHTRGRASNPIVLDTPIGKKKSGTKTGKRRGHQETSNGGTKRDNITRRVGANPETPCEESKLAARKEDGSPAEVMVMPGQWEISPNTSLDSTPVQGLTSPRRDLTLGTIGLVKDELTIGFIANEVPMEPELSPEPEEARPKTTETIRYGKEQEEEILRQVAEDSKRQGEADHEREE